MEGHSPAYARAQSLINNIHCKTPPEVSCSLLLFDLLDISRISSGNTYGDLAEYSR